MTYQPVPSELERVACPVCDDNRPIVVYDVAPYGVVRCRSCTTSYLSPRLNESAMLRFYEDDKYFENGDVGYTSYLRQEKSLRYSFRRFLQQLHRRKMAGGALLEVGCGYGFLLDEAKPYFDQRVGIDFSSAVTSASARADRVYQGDLEAIPREEQFDCIILVSVIEHVHRPVEYLTRLRERLRPGGKIVVATPNVDSIFRRLLGLRWPAFQVIPEHVAFYNRPTLAALMSKAGLGAVTDVPYVRAYPANLVVEEFNVWKGVLGRLGDRNVAFPGYMVALCGFAERAAQ
jgi:2-polyprenyl-3-methyl-5-hydroxy-6-metoxy-1,4-benzoquinol methylase